MDYYQKWAFAALVFLLAAAFLLVFGQTFLGVCAFVSFVLCLMMTNKD